MAHHHRAKLEPQVTENHHGEAPIAAISQYAVHKIAYQSDGPADFCSLNIPINPRNGHEQTNSQIHQQPQHSRQQDPQSQNPRPQQWHQPQNQHPGVRARYMHQTHTTAVPQSSSSQQPMVVESAALTLLPYCTVDTPLSESQVTAIANVAASLKDFVLLALGARDGDEECANKLGDALGSEQAAAGIVGFFTGDFEIE